MQMQPIIDKFLRSGKPTQLKLNADDRILITILASYMGKKTECWPPYLDLLDDTGIGSKTTLNKSITKLESLKIINVERFHRKNNRYTFDQMFLIPWVQIWTQEVQNRTQQSTDMDSNNIINNKRNKKPIYSKEKTYADVESQSTSAKPCDIKRAKEIPQEIKDKIRKLNVSF